MKTYLNNFGVWEIVINPPAPSNKKRKSTAQKEAKKDNATTLKFLMDGLLSSVKGSVGEYTLAKDLWFNLESEYQKARSEPQNTDESEEKPSEEVNQEEDKQEEDSSKGMDSCDYNDSLCDEIEKVLADDDEGLSKVPQEIHLTLLNIDLRANWVLNTVNLNHSEFTRFKRRILDSLNEYNNKP